MAGEYKVTFDFRKMTRWRADYTPIPAKISGGHENVRVIEDKGNTPRAALRFPTAEHWQHDAS